jgi:hypothetical protein
MRVSQAFPSKYVKAADLQDRAHLLTIRAVTMEDVGGDDAKPVVYFQGTDKGVVLNRTNAETIAVCYTDETDNWVGKQIEVYPDTTHFQGKLVACIRVRRPMPPAQAGGQSPFGQVDQRLSTPLPPPNAAPADPGPAGPDSYGHDLSDEIPF